MCRDLKTTGDLAQEDLMELMLLHKVVIPFKVKPGSVIKKVTTHASAWHHCYLLESTLFFLISGTAPAHSLPAIPA